MYYTTLLNSIAFGGQGASPAIDVVFSGGSIYLNQALDLNTSFTFANGNTYGVAVDLDNALIWFRLAPSGNWNNNASYNPATGVGGASFSSLASPALLFYPFAGFYNAGQVTANFGATAFSGTAPAGFTSGWDDSVSPVSYDVTTQMAAEVWGQASPAMETTQIAAEVWGTPNTWLAESGMVRETLYATTGTLRASGMVREVLRTYSGDISPSITGVAGTGRVGIVQMPPVATVEFKVQQRNLTAYEDEQLSQEWTLPQRLRNRRTNWTVSTGDSVSKFVQYEVLTTPTNAVDVSKFVQYDVVSTPNASLSVAKAVQYVVLQPPATQATVSGVTGTGGIGTVSRTISSQTTLTGVAGTSGVGTVVGDNTSFALWSGTDLVNTTVDAAHLAATATGQGGVRCTTAYQSGKYYFECTVNTIVNANTGVGIANALATLSNVAPIPTNAALVYKSGTIYVNNVPTGLSLGARSANDVIGIAVDLDNRLIWFRVAPAGNWNASAANNPATGVGGVSLTSAMGGGSFDVYPVAALGASADKVTANFGASAFTGTAPSGFTSGIPNAALTTNVVATQVGAEVFYSPNNAAVQLTQIGAEVFYAPTNSQFQVTQVGFEVWASAANVAYNVTQVGLEVWASVAVSPPIVGVSGYGMPGQPFGTGIPSVSGSGVCGTLTETVQAAPAGAQASGLVGSVVGLSTLASVSGTGQAGTVTPSAPPAGINITGVAGAAAVGSLSASLTGSITDVAGTGAAGAVLAQLEYFANVTGDAGSGAVGTASLEIDALATGVAGIGGAGSTSDEIDLGGLTGTTGTMEIGTVTAGAVETASITGVEGVTPSSEEILVTPSISKTLTGRAGVGAAASIRGQVAPDIIGVTATTDVGEVSTVSGLAVAIPDAFGTGLAGDFTEIYDSTITVPGANVTGIIGSLQTGGDRTVTIAGLNTPSSAAQLIDRAASIGSLVAAGATGTETIRETITLQGRFGAGQAGHPTAMHDASPSITGVSGHGLVGTAVVAHPELQVTQFGAETFLVPDPDLRSSQIGAEAFLVPDPAIQTSQVGAEAFLIPDPAIQASQLGAEVFLVPHSSLQVSQIGVEVFFSFIAVINVTETINGVAASGSVGTVMTTDVNQVVLDHNVAGGGIGRALPAISHAIAGNVGQGRIGLLLLGALPGVNGVGNAGQLRTKESEIAVMFLV